MTRRRGLLWLSCSLAALSVAGAIALGADAVRRTHGFASTATTPHLGMALAAVERDLARFQLSAGSAGLEETVRRFTDLRASLAAASASVAQAPTVAPRYGDALQALVHDLDALLVSGALQARDTAAMASIAVHAEALTRLAAVATEVEAVHGAAQSALAGTRMVQALMAAGLALLFGGVAMVLRDKRRAFDGAMLDAHRRATEEAARLSQARFVMMMSHELRTPLNGILGLLAIMRQHNPPETLRPLIAQAERAGSQLTAMLHDMLELESADLAAPEPVSPDPATFSPAGLALAMDELYAPVSTIGGPRFRATTVGDVPAAATGEGLRFQRAVSHLCSHVMETAGVEDVELAVSHDGAECRAEISFTHKAGPEAGMRMVEPHAGTADAGDETIGVGLGPLLAKGLLEQMGGRLEIGTLESGRILVLAATPSAPVEDVRPRVRILAQTRSLDAIGTAAAKVAGVQVLTPDTAPIPDIVLVEAGGEEEQRAVAEARTLWPQARVMALGAADDPSLFDDAIAPPLEPRVVADAVARAWQHCQTAAKDVSPPDMLRAG